MAAPLPTAGVFPPYSLAAIGAVGEKQARYMLSSNIENLFRLFNGQVINQGSGGGGLGSPVSTPVIQNIYETISGGAIEGDATVYGGFPSSTLTPGGTGFYLNSGSLVTLFRSTTLGTVMINLAGPIAARSLLDGGSDFGNLSPGTPLMVSSGLHTGFLQPWDGTHPLIGLAGFPLNVGEYGCLLMTSGYLDNAAGVQASPDVPAYPWEDILLGAVLSGSLYYPPTGAIIYANSIDGGSLNVAPASAGVVQRVGYSVRVQENAINAAPYNIMQIELGPAVRM